MAHHKRRKRKRAGNIGHCGQCQLWSGKGVGKKRQNSPAELRAEDAETESINCLVPFVLWDELEVIDTIQDREGVGYFLWAWSIKVGES